MLSSPKANTEALSTLKQAPDAKQNFGPNVEATLDLTTLSILQATYAEHWVNVPTQVLTEDQLQKLLHVIILSPKAGNYHTEWMEIEPGDALARAQVAEPTIKKCLQESWMLQSFSVLRNAGQ